MTDSYKNNHREIENTTTRQSALKLSFAQINEILERDVKKSVNKSYIQYGKDNIILYLANPASNLKNIIDVSRFLERYSSLYRKILNYYAASPLLYYNLIKCNDTDKNVKRSMNIRNYNKVAKKMHGFDVRKEFYNAIYQTVRDGMYVGYTYNGEGRTFMMPLDIRYCRIWGKSAGQWVVYFDAAYFSGSNEIFVKGINGDTSMCWDECFVSGYENYQKDMMNCRWFRLPTDKTFCMIAGADDQFDVPLPLFVGLFISLLDLSDLEQIIASKNELENYKILINKMPYIEHSDQVDDFAVQMPLAEEMRDNLDAILPSLVGSALVPWKDDVQVIDFDHSDRATSTDKLAQSTNNLFNNAGISQLVVAGGSSTNSVGLKYAIRNDMSNIWVYVDRIQSWLNYYIEHNISKNYIFYFHMIDWYNREEYLQERKDELAFGGSLLAYLTAQGKTPWLAMQEINFDNLLGLKSLMKPLQTSYTTTGDNNGGRPQEDDDELSEEGIKTRDGDKNEISSI